MGKERNKEIGKERDLERNRNRRGRGTERERKGLTLFLFPSKRETKGLRGT